MIARICGRALASFNAQAKAPDIHLLSLRAYMEELSASFNAQDQAPMIFTSRITRVIHVF